MCSQAPQELFGQKPLGLIEGTCFRDLRARCKQGANKEDRTRCSNTRTRGSAGAGVLELTQFLDLS